MIPILLTLLRTVSRIRGVKPYLSQRGGIREKLALGVFPFDEDGHEYLFLLPIPWKQQASKLI
jgi:hypothetical protein